MFIAISLIYFLVFIPINQTGAENAEMIAVFEVDEYAQYPHVLRMVRGGNSIKQTIRNFLVYGHYFYGYPFYFFSGLVLIPMRLVLGQAFFDQPQWIMLVLRQMVNVLPNMLSAAALTFVITRFRSTLQSVCVYVVMLTQTALFMNSAWWHPDALGLLFVALTFYFLIRDNHTYSKYFLAGAVTIGIAAGIKYLGLFFILTIPIYIGIGIMQKNLDWKTGLKKGVLFLTVMVLTVIVSNPLLLLPIERGEIIRTQLFQINRTAEGFLFAKQPFFTEGKPPQWFRDNFRSIAFLVLQLLVLVLSLRKKQTRLPALLIATFIIPMSMVTWNVTQQRTHYWLPVSVPLLAALGLQLYPAKQPIQRNSQILRFLLTGVIIIQSVLFVRTDIRVYQKIYQRESLSASLLFYEDIQEIVFDDLIDETQISIYRDWQVYFPEEDNVSVMMDWDLANYELIEETGPDFLILEQSNIQAFGSVDFLSTAADRNRLTPLHEFYADALENSIDHYIVVYEDSFGKVFRRCSP